MELDLAALLAGICDELVETGAQIRLLTADAAPFFGRRWALKRALRNLIDNALKYGGHAEVTLSLTPGYATILVDDAGPGIPPNELENVFRPFYRLERSRSRDTGGTGLGLAVARSVVRVHGGDITLANRQEGGLWQSVMLPR